MNQVLQSTHTPNAGVDIEGAFILYCPKPFKRPRNRNPHIKGCWYCGRSVDIHRDPHFYTDRTRLTCEACY